jgi:hypothetical protein
MAAQPISLQPLNDVNHPIVDGSGVLKREFVQWLMTLVQSFLLIPQSTSGGNIAYPLPAANTIPNRELLIVKTSSDGNTLSAAAQGNDLINKQGAWAAASLTIGTAQGAFARLRSDGMSNWYVL